MSTHGQFVLRFYALTTIVLLVPVCVAQLPGSSTTDSDTTSQTSSGFGYELLRSQLDEMQASILQLQQIAERRNECAGLDNNIATILNRLEKIEMGLKESGPPHSGPTNIPEFNFNEERLQTIIGNILNSRQRNSRVQEIHDRIHPPFRPNAPRPPVFDQVYDSCDDVPSSGVWKIRNGIQISNVQCFKF
ncbi:uncharacterized protein LOC128304779 [Anopheles moucheti]|uniref:uncharacterized protein LOC128304779 n=1 Tax=Anopheles moucheti TaxID=186751 RepID=UPI0022F0291B|nr:uncharacterized protein LOC128304779 [Anopheles moucheti]